MYLFNTLRVCYIHIEDVHEEFSEEIKMTN